MEQVNYFVFALLCAMVLCGLKTASASTARYHHPAAFVEALQHDPHAGKKVYQEFCQSCHAAKPMIPMGAPRFRQTDDWGWRLKKPKTELYKNIFNGVRNMPARGGCFECSDKLLIAATNYMLPPKTPALKFPLP